MLVGVPPSAVKPLGTLTAGIAGQVRHLEMPLAGRLRRSRRTRRAGRARRRPARTATADAVRRHDVDVDVRRGLRQRLHHHHAGALSLQEVHGRHQPAGGSAAVPRLGHPSGPGVLVEERRRLDADGAHVEGELGHRHRRERLHAERPQRVERRRGVGLGRRLGQLVERRLQDRRPSAFARRAPRSS